MHPKIQQDFFVTDMDGSTEKYGLLILSRISLSKVSFISLPTLMGRSCLVVDFCINEKPFKIATVHLESLSNPKIREAQLFVMQHFLSSHENVILCGDFNFDSYRNYWIGTKPLENDVLSLWDLEHYLDTWKHVHPNLSGYTYDSEKNISCEETMRYDRILLKSKDWAPKSIKIIGDQDIGIENVFLSDHFGLECEIKYKSQ